MICAFGLSVSGGMTGFIVEALLSVICGVASVVVDDCDGVFCETSGVSRWQAATRRARAAMTAMRMPIRARKTRARLWSDGSE